MEVESSEDSNRVIQGLCTMTKTEWELVADNNNKRIENQKPDNRDDTFWFWQVRVRILENLLSCVLYSSSDVPF